MGESVVFMVVFLSTRLFFVASISTVLLADSPPLEC
jgi:hypothetical protein